MDRLHRDLSRSRRSGRAARLDGGAHAQVGPDADLLLRVQRHQALAHDLLWALAKRKAYLANPRLLTAQGLD